MAGRDDDRSPSLPDAPASGERSLTQLLLAWRKGSPEALGLIMEKVYPELRKIAARHYRSESRRQTLEPSALVAEVYLRMADGVGVDWRNRRHFYAVASGIMRNVLVDRARTHAAKKRQRTDVPLPSSGPSGDATTVDILDLNEALLRLEKRYPVPARVVELRFFGGLSMEEAALELRTSRATAERAWTFARAWLFRELSRPGPGAPAAKAARRS